MCRVASSGCTQKIVFQEKRRKNCRKPPGKTLLRSGSLDVEVSIGTVSHFNKFQKSLSLLRQLLSSEETELAVSKILDLARLRFYLQHAYYNV